MKSTVLAVETSGTLCSVALVRGPAPEPSRESAVAAPIYTRRAPVGNAHSQHVMAMIRDVLADASLSLHQCDAIAYAAGPGSFTGLRIACAVAQGLAFGAHRPVVAVGTLDAIAHSALSSLDGRSGEILVAMDARMGEVYWTLSNWTSGRLTMSRPPALASPPMLRRRIAELAGRPIAFGCGNAWSIYRDAMNGVAVRVIHRDAADAVDVAHLARLACLEGKAMPPDAAGPIYVRDDVALTTAERDAMRRGGSTAPLAAEAGHGA